MSELTIWHNPRCRKSREVLQLLEAKGADLEIVKYLETPPSAGELDRVLTSLNMQPRQLMRRKEAPYRDLNLADEKLSRDDLIAAMVENPILIERPVVIRGSRAALGRPAENVLDLLN